MTQCIGSPAQEMAEQYLAGELEEPEAEQFENHYFACELCHEQVRTLADLREALAAKPVIVPAIAPRPVAVVPRQGLSMRILAFPVPLAVLGSLAAMLLVVAVLVQVRRSMLISPQNGANAVAKTQPAVASPKDNQDRQVAALQQATAPVKSADKHVVAEPATTELASLADVQLPGYQAPLLRGGEAGDSSHAAFVTGMQAYSEGECGRAVDTLAKVLETAAEGVAAKLYSGLCQLKARDLDHAVASFTEVNSAGDTPELETAEYFLAQTMLLRGDVAGAKNWLSKTVALHGDYEERAQTQIAKLPK